jgi:thiol-disulfide isomerase/thioredoxin
MRSIPSRRRLLLAAAAFTAARSAHAQSMRSDWPRSKPAPALALTLLDGSAWSLPAQRGHPVLLNFWATWCEPCREEMPALARLAEREQASGLRVVAVNFRESEAAVRHFAETSSLALPVALDPSGDVAKLFDAHVFPSTVAIDAAGRARFVVKGACDWTDARSRGWLDELLGRRR